MKINCEQFETGDGRGFGVRVCSSSSSQDVPKGALVLPYVGDLIRGKRAAEARESQRNENDMPGYMMFFQWRKATWAIDATDSAHISRFINHSRRHANLVPVLLKDPDNPNQPVIFFKATRRIARGEELLFDYGDRSPESVEGCPWLLE